MFNTWVCVYCMCRQELCRVQSSAGDGHGQSHGPPLDPASLPSLPLHILVFRAQTSTTDLYSFTQCELQRGGRREKGQKGQERTEHIRSPWFSGFCLCCFVFGFVIFAPESRGSLRQKGLFSRQWVRVRKRRMWRKGDYSTVEGWTVKGVQETKKYSDNKCPWHPRVDWGYSLNILLTLWHPQALLHWPIPSHYTTIVRYSYDTSQLTTRTLEQSMRMWK